jgi:primosomal protein N' (replication factor Y) (superfamily II helicase)
MIVDVAVPYRVPQSFHYSVNPEMEEALSLGSLVQVPFRNRATYAFVLGFPTETTVAASRLKSVESVLVQAPLFDEAMLRFLKWVSEYYCSPLGEVLATAFPKDYWKSSAKPRKAKAGATDAVQGLVPSNTERPKLTDEQRTALAQILDPKESRPVLLHGVTGSGKTEVYMGVLDSVLQQGKGAIILVPEIALTPQLLGRFSARFPGQVAVLHSDLTPKERFQQWEKVQSGTARIVIGARSAVFAPVKSLGLIVVDEEHESTFKQEDSLRYHGRDVAIVRGHMEKARVLLGSATPSLESYSKAQSGKYCYVTLKQRVHQRAMPQTHFVDLKDPSLLYSPETPWLTHFLLEKLQKTLKDGQQSLLYLNRLGFAHFLFCRDCGHTWRCRNCDVALTYYTHPPSLQCHYCGAYQRPPSTCETCSGTDLTSIGVGTEQVEKVLSELLPTARIIRLDRSVVKTRKTLESVLNSIAHRQVDIAIGTQMIAKGHDFPGIALVGILLADSSINLPDFRAHERTYQIITQVSGRAGRADVVGEVVIQTLNPEHPVLLAAAENRATDFYRFELDTRKQFGYPPFRRLAMLRFQHRQANRVQTFSCVLTGRLGAWLRAEKVSCDVLGPSEAPLSKVKNLYRWQCLLRSDSVKSLQQALRFVSEYVAAQKNPVQVTIDVDPMNAL